MTALNIPKEMQKALPHVNLVGNAFWYANEIKGKVAIYTYNWKTGEQKKAASSKIDKKAKGNLMIYVDEDYIYCSELAIPRHGGKAKRLLKNAVSEYLRLPDFLPQLRLSLLILRQSDEL